MLDLKSPISNLEINHVALVVRSLDSAMKEYWERLGIGPWTIFRYGPEQMQEMTWRGQPQHFSMRFANAQAGPLRIELIESLQGPNLYDDFLNQHGEGLHHIGGPVPCLDAAIPCLEAHGYQIAMSARRFGVHGDGAFAYFVAPGSALPILELIEYPKERIPPEGIYPATDSARSEGR